MLRRNFFCVLGLALTLPARAVSVLPLSLDQMIDTAATAFEGTCTANRVERDAATNLIVTHTTFLVKEVLKGAVSDMHTIKQIGGELAEAGLGYRVSGVPSFAVGQDYVVLLAGVSAAGFSSPIGLAQGRFTVRQTGSGPKVSNGRNFREMTVRMPSAVLPGGNADVGQLDLEDFKQLVRARATGRTQ